MLSRIRKSMDEKDQGFTLIELLVVIIIIGILAAIAIPVFLNQRKKGWDAAVKADLRNAVTAEETALTQTGLYSDQVLTSDTPSDPKMVSLESVGFKYSAASNYTLAAGATTGTIVATVSAGNSYCLLAQSASGTYFSFGSTTGLAEQGTTATCPSQG